MSDDSFEIEREAINSMFDTVWGNTTPIKRTNLAAPKVTDVKNYVALTYQTGQALQASVQENALHRYPGLVIVQVFQKEDTGTSELRQLVGKVAEIFRRKDVIVPGPACLRFETPYPLEVGANNGWYQVNVVCPFTRDIHHAL